MNSKIIAATVIAMASLSSVSAFAGGESQDFFAAPASNSMTTRAQVNADYLKAQQGVSFTRGGDSADFVTSQAPTANLTRTQVRAEAVMASRMPLASDYQGTN